uniref:Saposin B-type domain-containing protein n=1 Tax=Angiostrongylus cantonensis TaxID=6313 RepID=A0A0K0DLC3_ANGCA
MVFSTTAGVRARVPDIATSMAGAQASVSRIVMQAVIDVLERQGRSAGLSDDIIAIILGQLTVQINYTPLECKEVAVNQNPAMACKSLISNFQCCFENRLNWAEMWK